MTSSSPTTAWGTPRTWAISALLKRQQADLGTDLTSALLTLTDESGRPALERDDMQAHLIGVTAAGTDTAANLVVHLVRLFTAFPDQRDLVLADPTRWTNAAPEAMRRSAIASALLRRSTRDTELGGIALPAGSPVYVILPAANADPAVFPDPLRFDVRRANAGSHLGFGRGRHRCLGAPLAVSEAHIAVSRLYDRLPGLRADLSQGLRFLPSTAVRGLTSQRVEWDLP